MKRYTREETQRLHEIILTMHENGCNLDEISEKTGYKQYTIKQYLYSHGDYAADKRKRSDIRNKKIHELYSDGLSMRQIGLQCDCSSSTVKLVLQDIRFGNGKVLPKKKLTVVEKKTIPVKVKREDLIIDVPKVSEKVMVIENGRYVEKVKIFRDVTELCSKQKIYMERRMV